MTAAIFYLRYQTTADQVAYYAQILGEMNRDLPAAKLGAVTYFHRTVMLSGSIIALVFIFKPNWTDKRQLSQDEP